MVSRGGGEHVSRTEECPLLAVLSRQNRHVPLSAGTLAVTWSSWGDLPSPGRWVSIMGHCASQSADKTGEWGKPVWLVMLHKGKAAPGRRQWSVRVWTQPGVSWWSYSTLFPFQNHPGGCSVLWSAFPGHCWSTGHGWVFISGCTFPGVAVTDDHKLGDWNSRTLFPHGSGGQKSRISHWARGQVLAGGSWVSHVLPLGLPAG